jgi:hypothetical protein
LLNKKTSTLSEWEYHIVSTTLLVFVNADEILIMADDVTMPSNSLISLVEKEELEKAPFDVNISQRSREKKPSRKVVRTQVDCSAWDRQLSPNPHVLAIYLKFVPTCGTAPKTFEECQHENNNVRLHCRTWVPGDGHHHWLRGLINPFSWSIEPNT